MKWMPGSATTISIILIAGGLGLLFMALGMGMLEGSDLLAVVAAWVGGVLSSLATVKAMKQQQEGTPCKPAQGDTTTPAPLDIDAIADAVIKRMGEKTRRG